MRPYFHKRVIQGDRTFFKLQYCLYKTKHTQDSLMVKCLGMGWMHESHYNVSNVNKRGQPAAVAILTELYHI